MSQQSDKPAEPLRENPYFHRGPIKDHRYFYGRKAEIRRAFHLLRNGQCISIIGPRRVGKTSLLFHICAPTTRRKFGLSRQHLFVYVDGQVLGHLKQNAFYHWVWAKLLEAGETEIQKSMEDYYRAFLPQKVDSFEAFQKGIQTLAQDGFSVVFLFDEFEIIATNQDLDHAFFSRLRSLAQEYNVAYVTFSQMSLDKITCHDQSVLNSPFFTNFASLSLGFMKRAEADDVIRGPVQKTDGDDFYTSADMSFLYDVAGLHPFFLQVACYYLFERKIERGSLIAEDYLSVQQQYVEDVERHFQYIWNHLTEEEKKAAWLASEERSNNLSKGMKRRLERKCVLYKDAIFSSVFADFVKSQAATLAGSDRIVKVEQARGAEAQAKESQEQGCRLDIMCDRQGQISVRLSGAISYQGGGTIPFDVREIQSHARRVADARRLPSWRFQIREIGLDLYRKLFQNQPDVLTSYNRAKGRVQDSKLRISFSAPREFLRLSFEALFAEEEMYLCLKHPLSRHVRGYYTDKRALSAASTERLRQRDVTPRALLVASNTWHSPAEDISSTDVEVEEVGALLRQHGFDVQVLLTQEATLQRVQNELENGGYCLFHYAGHGSYNADSPERSALRFWETTMGQSNIVELTAARLESMVRNTPLLFAYLSCCYGAKTGEGRDLLDDDFLGVMDALVMGGIPAVLGFRWPISDQGARALAHSFYTTLLQDGKELDEALLHARNMLDRDEQDWFSPILVMQHLFP